MTVASSTVSVPVGRILYDAVLGVRDQAAISPAAREASRLLLLDFISGIVASRSKDHDRFLSSARLAPASPYVAFELSARSHFLDYDDIYTPGKLHIAPVIWPALFALGDLSGTELISSHIASVAGLCAATESIRPHESPQMKLYFVTQLFGAIGAALAGSVRLGLSGVEAANALGIAFMQSSGAKEAGAGLGSNSRQIYPAYAALSGTSAVELAQLGFQGPPRWVEGPAGLAQVLLADPDYPGRLAAALDKLQVGRIHDIDFKLWPCCKSTHKYLLPFLDPLNRDALPTIGADQLVGLQVPAEDRFLVEPRAGRAEPKTIADAKFSIPFTVAMALTRGVLLEAWTQEALEDPVVLSLARRLADNIEPAAAAALVVATSGETTVVPGVPVTRAGWDMDAALGKFHECWRYAGIDEHELSSAALLDAVLAIEDVTSIHASPIGTLLRLN